MVAFTSVPNLAWTPLTGCGPVSSPALLPTSVPAPVAVTRAEVSPAATTVPSYSMLVRSATSAAAHAAADFATSWDSPVRLDSSASSARASRIRQSAGTASPARRVTTSPGTRRSANTSRSTPPRLTRTGTAVASARRMMARSVPTRWTPPINAFSPITAPIRTASVNEPPAADRPAPAARIGVSGLARSSSEARRTLGSGRRSAGGREASRAAASSSVSPSGVLARRPNATSGSTAYQ